MSLLFAAPVYILLDTDHSHGFQAGLLQLATPSRVRKNEKRKAKPPFPSEHRTIQSVDGEQDGQSLLASFLLDAPCMTPQAPSRRSPKNALQHGADVYEGHFSEHAVRLPLAPASSLYSPTPQQTEQDGLPSMDVLVSVFVRRGFTYVSLTFRS